MRLVLYCMKTSANIFQNRLLFSMILIYNVSRLHTDRYSSRSAENKRRKRSSNGITSLQSAACPYHLSRQKRAENWMAKCQTLLVDWPVKTVAKEIDKIVNSQLTVKNKRCHSSTFSYILIRATLLIYISSTKKYDIFSIR